MIQDARDLLGVDLSPENEALLDAIGIVPPSRAERILAASGRDERAAVWTADLVRSRIREGAKVIERTERSPRPSKKLTWWPDWQALRGITDFDRNAWAEGERCGTRAPAKMKVGASALDIARAEQSLEWLARYLAANEAERRAVSTWIWCVAKRQSWSQWWKLAGPTKPTATRRRDRGFSIIVAGLRADAIEPE
ncbi:hypothetical protein [Methylocystis echinoides]|uniref:Uncharacterized protein n=1 Tax=Methylocystis echinoides TaxID=29468 RepID=A0A9W6LT64_9HYPH|nr:hypothetical protein [Methylocystis echinoides]GLI94313.1 hypothetical protein LMG27198_33050 [Methylocystis echinoides]